VRSTRLASDNRCLSGGWRGIGRWTPVAVLLVCVGVGHVFAQKNAAAREEVAGTGAPEITAISPRWAPSGWEFSLTIHGRNLAGATEVRFVPSTGIAVAGPPLVNQDGTVAVVKVAIMIHAPLGPRRVVVRTPSGESSLSPTEANTFKVSFAHLH
jgi:hypothetical protein